MPGTLTPVAAPLRYSPLETTLLAALKTARAALEDAPTGRVAAIRAIDDALTAAKSPALAGISLEYAEVLHDRVWNGGFQSYAVQIRGAIDYGHGRDLAYGLRTVEAGWRSSWAAGFNAAKEHPGGWRGFVLWLALECKVEV